MKPDEAELAEIQDRIEQSLDLLDRGEFAAGSVEEVFDRAFERAKQRRS